MSRWSAADVRAVRAKHLQAKPSKYKNVKTVVDGITFDSKREAARWLELQIQQRIGLVRNITRQTSFSLQVKDQTIGHYLADFVYERQAWGGPSDGGLEWVTVVEDVKSPGTRTAIYQWKKKHMKAQYAIDIKET